MKGLKSIVGSNVKYPLYLGNFADGEVSTTGNITFTNTLDGPAVVKSYKKLTVNAGHTVTVQNPCRGLIIYANELIVNGTITMSEKGSISFPSNSGEYKIPYKAYNGEIKEWIELPKVDSYTKGSGRVISNFFNVPVGGYFERINGLAGNSSNVFGVGGGGGGSGVSRSDYESCSKTSVPGANGSCFSGGAGGPWGENPFGGDLHNNTYNGPFNLNYDAAVSGQGGGLLIIVAKNLTGGGTIISKGNTPPSTQLMSSFNSALFFMGGCKAASGSGPIIIYSNVDTFTGTVSSPVVTVPDSHSPKGGDGGAGYIHREVI
jgi:hypothetical protein